MTEQTAHAEWVAARCSQCGQDMRGTDYIKRIQDERDAARVALLREQERCAEACKNERLDAPVAGTSDDGHGPAITHCTLSIYALPDLAGVDLTLARKVVEEAELYGWLRDYATSIQWGNLAGVPHGHLNAAIKALIAQEEHDRG